MNAILNLPESSAARIYSPVQSTYETLNRLAMRDGNESKVSQKDDDREVKK